LKRKDLVISCSIPVRRSTDNYAEEATVKFNYGDDSFSFPLDGARPLSLLLKDKDDDKKMAMTINRVVPPAVRIILI
jgi:hypothetical protein